MLHLSDIVYYALCGKHNDLSYCRPANYMVSLSGMVLRTYFAIFLASASLSNIGMVQSFINVAIKGDALRHHLSNQKLALFSTSAWLPDYSSYKKDFGNITDDQWDKLEVLSLKLYDWNTKVNLVSRKDVEFLIPNHVIPCLAMSLIRNFGAGETVIDVGTGGGLPGLPLAIICPDAHFTLLDSNSKKMMVVSEIASSLGLKNVNVVCSRAEKLTDKFDFLLGRAVSALPNFLSFSSHLIDEKSRASSSNFVRKPSSESAATGPSSIAISSGMLYLKGGDFSDEIKESGILNHHLFPVSDIAPSVASEKFVLYIPASEIVDFKVRSVAAAVAAAAASKTR